MKKSNLRRFMFNNVYFAAVGHVIFEFFFFFQAEDGIRDHCVTGVQTCALPISDEGVKRLSLLIARMSEAAQLEGILQGSEKEYFDLAAVVSGCVDGYRLVYPSAQFEFSRPSNPIMIKGLPDAIAQLLDKLIQNATDFAAPDTAIVTSVFTESGDALLTVENRGPAISAAVLPTLFTSMVSAREHGGNQHSHLGLGLYIVRLIADFHGGDVSASNLRDNSGVRFEFRIPLG